MENMNNTLFAHWNTNSDGTPTSVQLSETQKVSPIHYCIQLNQIPDDVQQLTVTIGSTQLSEVFDTETIGANNYKVDYGDGIVWFSPNRAGQSATILYYGRGYKTISAKRVMIENIGDGAYIETNTLQHLVDLNKQAQADITNIQNNLNAILADCNKYASTLKTQLDNLSYDTANDMKRAYGELYSKMDKYVGDVLKTKTQAINEMRASLNQYVQEAQVANQDMDEAIANFNTKSTKYIADLNKSYDDALKEIQRLSEQVQSSIVSLHTTLAQYAREQKEQMDIKTRNVEEYRVKIKDDMKKALDDLYEFSNERKETLDAILAHAREVSVELERIFQTQQLVWEGAFDDAQLDRLQKFMDSQTVKQHEFDMAQTARERDFIASQTEQQEDFEEAEAERDEVFNAMKDMVYDENAVLKNTELSNTKFDEIVHKREYQEVNNPLEVGGVRRVLGDKLEFYSNKVKEDGTTAKEKLTELFLIGRESTWKGTQSPIDTESIWYDVSEEDWKNIPLPQDVNFQQFQDAVNEIRSEITNVATAVRLDEVRPGTFFNEGSSSASVDKTIDKDGNEVPNRTITTNKIKVGLNPKLMQLEEGELAYCMDTETLYIGVRKNEVSTITINKKIGGQSSGGDSGGGNNLTGEYLQLDGKDGNKYRIYIDEDGELKQRLVEFLDAEKPKADEGARYKGLLVNRYFGGGAKGANIAPLSHGFIELYNNAPEERNISLNGLALYYKTIDDPTWRRFELHGYIPWHCSYLIRGARVNSIENSSCRYEIERFDQHWDKDFSNTSAMIYLGVDTGALTIVNPFNLNDGTESKSYINILSGAGVNEERSLTAVEYDKTKTPSYRKLLTPDCGIQRRDFASTKSTYKDIEQINFRTCDMSIYHPRCVEDGKWDLYYNKTRLNENIPNLVNIQYGKQWHTRTFTWQSKIMNRGYLRYRKLGSSQWIYKDTNTQIVYHKDQDCTIHRCIVRNLPEGTYEYQCGDEGYWGDVYTFKVKSYQNSNGTPDRNQHIKFLQVSDQQSFYEDDYEAWRWASKYIEDHEADEDYDWVLNTGDISQSGNRSFEWRSYYKFPRFLREKPHILCCGNNDLFEKKYSNCFKYYDTTEHDFNGDKYIPNYLTHQQIQGITPYGEGNYSSIWTFDLGYVHFINVNSNITADVEDPDIWVKQMVWLKAELEQVRRRPNPPRWYVMLTHYGALTVTRMKTVQQMIPFVEDLGIHLVICGHHHSYSRSQPVKMNIRQQVEAITGHDLYDVYSGCGQAITAAVYKIGYLESFLNKQNVKEIPKGVTYDQTTPNGTLENGTQGVVTNGNEGSRQAYVNQQQGTYWVMCNATGSKLKSNKDLEKDPTPWWYAWANYNEQSGLWANKPHPYHPNYIMWDISYDSITLKSYVVKGIMEMDNILKDAVVIPPDRIDYSTMEKELIDSFTIPWRNLEE